MTLKLRLARAGSKKRPYYHVVVADVRSPRDGRYIERVGSYNPMLPKEGGERVKIDVDRVKHWLSVGAQPTDRVSRFLDTEGLLKREARNNPNKAKPGKKAVERVEEKAAAEQAKIDAVAAAEQAKKDAAEAAAAAPAEEAAAEEAAAEAPAEETKAE